MTIVAYRLVRFLSVVLCWNALWGAGVVEAKEQSWLTSYESARALALKTGRPICIVFR